MAMPSRVEDWFQLVPHLVLEEGWHTLIHSNHGSLQCCECPWGGTLLKCKEEVMVQEDLENPSDLLVRPEVRAHYGSGNEVDDLKLLQQTAPGEALLEPVHSWGLSSFCGGFLDFGNSQESDARRSWYRLSRDFPDEGDSALCICRDDDNVRSSGASTLVFCRPVERQFYEVNGIFHASEMDWSSIHLRLLLESAGCMAQWFVNRPGISHLRQADRDFYTLLTVQSCRRGLPLLPVHGSDDDVVVTINDGKELGLDRWTRFDPVRHGQEKFSLAFYIRLFLQHQKIHDNFEAFPAIDGCQLVSFQCVVRTHEWDQVKERFYSAFLMQKKAYRHLNGGSTAPSLREHGKARPVRNELQNELAEKMLKLQEHEATQHKVVVRRTFLDVEEPKTESPKERSRRRHRTASVLLVAC